MKAGVYYGVEDFRVAEFPEPELKEDGVKIAVKYCGVCGTDVHKFHGQCGSHPMKPPVPLGHEVSGVVVETGKHVTHFKVGDRVVADPNWGCGACFFCKNNMPHMCENGKGVVKGFAQYICPPESNVYHIPDHLSLREAALAEPLSCCLHGMDLLDVKLGDVVVVIGMGMIGSMMVKLCSIAGASHIIVIETQENKRESAKDYGATLFINPNVENVETVIAQNGIQNVDKVMECVGAKVTMRTAFEVAGKCATIVLFGLGKEGEAIDFYPYEAFRKELTIRASYVNPHTMERAVRLLSSNQFSASMFISKEIQLEEAEEELRTQKDSRYGKVLVHIS